MKALALAGQVFGRLTVLDRVGSHKGKSLWRCRCSCGSDAEVTGPNLAEGQTRSCGCLVGERLGDARRTHGRSGTREYKAWATMKERCRNPRCPAWKFYGARGITVCDAWRGSFAQFLADMGPCPAGHSIERREVNGNYEPSNCLWLPIPLQAKNRRSSRYVEIDGRRIIQADFAREIGVSQQTLSKWLKRGISAEQARVRASASSS